MVRQLRLFAGKRQRGIEVKPRTKEYELHCMVADMLRRWCNPNWRYTHLPMGEKREPVTAMRLKRMGVTPGWPDFMFVQYLTGDMVWLELKRPNINPALSEAQQELAQFLDGCRSHQYICTNDFQMALDLLRDRGIVRSKVST